MQQPVLKDAPIFAGLCCLILHLTLPTTSHAAATLFEELSPANTHVTFTHPILPDHPHAYLYESGYPCGGLSLGDLNNDGLPDLFIVNGPDENALFLNQGNFQFLRAPIPPELADGPNWGVSSTLADVNGDGHLDLLLANYGAPNKIFLNDGKGQFRDVTSASGFAYAGPSQELYAADFDNDGDLDLFLLTNRFYSRSGRPRITPYDTTPDGQQRMKKEFAPFFRIVRPESEVVPTPGTTTDSPPPPFMLEYGHPDRIYRNDGNSPDGIPHFTDVTSNTPLAQTAGHGLSALIWDVNGDHLPDIYVANDYTDPDCLWINQGTNAQGFFQFRDAIQNHLPYTSWSSMGSDVSDIDGDGHLDFMVADMAGSSHFKHQRTSVELVGWRRWIAQNGWPRQSMRNTLFLGTGIHRFQEAAFEAGVARTDWTWAVKFGDYDLDGRPDLFLTTGAARLFTDADILVEPAMLVGRVLWDTFRGTPEGREQNFAFHNQDGLHFQDVSQAWGLNKTNMSYGAATADLDGDGDLDLVVCNLGENVSIYRNNAAQSSPSPHWLKIRLQGRANRFALGAVVTATLDSGLQVTRLSNPQTGYLSGNDPTLHFGLGPHTRVASLRILWPSGLSQSLGPQKANQLLTLQEPISSPITPTPPQPPTLFVESAHSLGLDFTHHERAFNDYERERLLPAKLSQSGPGISVADVNQDGLDDIFIAGATSQPSTLFLQQSNHSFAPLPNPPWNQYPLSETSSALFFDADRDGDLDLYIVSGSNELETNDPLYRDHLYLNQLNPSSHSLSFIEAPPSALPDIRQSGSCIVGADFDRDGDIDLFIGTRSIPGHYPTTGDSTLLRNDSTGPNSIRFTDVTDSAAPGLRQVGLVTSAIWSDADGDGQQDLWITCEWGQVHLFLNQQGKLTDITQSPNAGLNSRLGWWNSITGGDIDSDGDTDYLILNAGSNTKYGTPSTDSPILLYYGDMDGNEAPELFEAWSFSNAEWPMRARYSAIQAVPLLSEKFPTHRSYASATLKDLFGAEPLQKAQRLSATELRSGMLLNHSKPGIPRFEWVPLPARAQLSPGYGAALSCFQGSNSLTAFISQNSYAREMETGLWRGDFGATLDFSPIPAQPPQSLPAEQSGFIIPGDGKALAIADLNHDHIPDLLASQNNAPLLAFLNSSARSTSNPPIAIQLKGPPGNPQAIGSRITLSLNNRILASTEIHAGSGYLSQSTATAYLPYPHSSSPAAGSISPTQPLQISVRWPSSPPQTTQISLAHFQSPLTLTFPPTP